MGKPRKEIKILLVEDAKLDEEAARSWLTRAGYQDIDIARSADEARIMMKEKQFDFVIVDPKIPRGSNDEPNAAHGLALIDDVKLQRIPLLAFSMAVTRDWLVPLIRLEIGCIRKHDVADPDLLASAIDTTLEGAVVYSATAMSIIRNTIAAEKHPNDYGLSMREREVIYLWACRFHGSDTADTRLADLLHIQEDTVGRHRRNAMEKLGIHAKAQLATWVLEHENLFDDIKLIHKDVIGDKIE